MTLTDFHFSDYSCGSTLQTEFKRQTAALAYFNTLTPPNILFVTQALLRRQAVILDSYISRSFFDSRLKNIPFLKVFRTPRQVAIYPSG